VASSVIMARASGLAPVAFFINLKTHLGSTTSSRRRRRQLSVVHARSARLHPGWRPPQTSGFLSNRHAHTRARRTHTHTPCVRIRKDPCLSMSVHRTARMTVSLAPSPQPTTLPLCVERSFARQLQPPKVCGPQARLSCHDSTPGPGAYCPLQEGHIWGGGGGGRTRECLAALWSECCSSLLLNLDRRSPARQAPTATARARDPPEISRDLPELACHRPPLPCRIMRVG